MNRILCGGSKEVTGVRCVEKEIGGTHMVVIDISTANKFLGKLIANKTVQELIARPDKVGICFVFIARTDTCLLPNSPSCATVTLCVGRFGLIVWR